MARDAALLDKSTTERYLTLPQPDSGVQVMYVWIDGSGEHLRCKTKTVDFIPKAAEGMKENYLKLSDPDAVCHLLFAAIVFGKMHYA